MYLCKFITDLTSSSLRLNKLSCTPPQMNYKFRTGGNVPEGSFLLCVRLIYDIYLYTYI